MPRTVLLGRVEAFDAARGTGSVIDQGGRVLPFHCTAIADGSRHIEVGATVAFTAVPGHLGRLEATGLIDVGP